MDSLSGEKGDWRNVATPSACFTSINTSKGTRKRVMLEEHVGGLTVPPRDSIVGIGLRLRA